MYTHAVTLADVTAETAAELGGILQQATAEGWNVTQVQQAITGHFDWMSQTRALMIARTETVRALNLGQLAHYHTVGVQQKAWSTALDTHVCEVCEPLEAKVAPIDGVFEPGGFYAPPDTHPNCRCRVIAYDLVQELE